MAKVVYIVEEYYRKHGDNLIVGVFTSKTAAERRAEELRGRDPDDDFLYSVRGYMVHEND